MTVMLAVSASWMVGWSVAFHLATDDHHARHQPDYGDVLGLEMALHGHAHAEGTPTHGHPVVGSVAAPISGRMFLLIGVMIGAAPEVVLTDSSGRWLLARAGPTHDPPPRPEVVSVLRI